VIQINKDGTAVKYKPGVICGGPYLSHDCPASRGIGYFLEGILCLAPFGKQPTTITLTGVTNHPKDLSVDSYRNATLFLVELFGISGCTLQVIKRGAPPLGGGEVKLSVPMVKQLNPIQVVDEGMIKRIRGIAYVHYVEI
jgi:RNA 3'-terminal phosphate cyclase-like protein